MFRPADQRSSLRSCQKLAEDLPASIQAAKPLFDALNAWRATVPVPEPFRSERLANLNDADSYPASVYFAYLTLVVYVWRALLRPTVRSLPPPQIIDVDQPLQEHQGPLQDTGFLFEDFSWDFSDLPEIELHLEDDVTDTSATVKELHQAAQTWAVNLVNFTWHMSSSDFGEFWYSCTFTSCTLATNYMPLPCLCDGLANSFPRRVSHQLRRSVQLPHGAARPGAELRKRPQGETDAGELAPRAARPEQGVPAAAARHDAPQRLLLGRPVGDVLPAAARARGAAVKQQPSPLTTCRFAWCGLPPSFGQ